MNTQIEQDVVEEIAIIGMACRFPGADTLTAFWENLKHGVESRTLFTDAELLAAGVAPTTLHDPDYVKAGYLLTGVEQFDADFFGFSPRQAQLTDPQQRLFLECAWEALENAGIDVINNDKIIGVYAGAALNHYMLTYRDALRQLDGSANHLQWLIGNDKDYLAMQTAYKLNLRGPCVNAQTACSTGLVLVHMACQSLLTYECDVALAGSATIQIPQLAGYFYQEESIFSPDGRCRSFDAAGQGSAFGSGVGIVALKRLSEAIADGDHIWAVIKGSAVNNDGARKVGFTAPSVDGQARVIAEAQAVAGVGPESISYIEAQGTATAIGDAMEFAALMTVFGPANLSPHSCAVGAVKTNIGHLQVAAGMAALIKTVLALYHGQLPPSLNFTTPNPRINFADSPFYVNTQLTEWPTGALPRRAGVTAFGIGGTNAHLIVEAAPVPATVNQAPAPPPYLLTISAKTDAALRALVERYTEFLTTVDECMVGDLCYTSQVGRSHFPHRLGVIGASGQALRASLLDYLQGLAPVGVNYGIVAADDPTCEPINPLTAPFLSNLDAQQRLARLSELYVAGATIAWPAQDSAGRQCKVVLPSYPFQRQRYWVDASLPTAPAHNGAPTDAMPTLVEQLAATDSANWLPLFVQYLQTTAAQVLAVADPTQIDPSHTLLHAGLDSLLIIELRNRVKKRLPTVTLPITLFLETPLQQIAALLEEAYLHTLLTEALAAAPVPTSAAPAVPSSATLEELAEEFIV